MTIPDTLQTATDPPSLTLPNLISCLLRSTPANAYYLLFICFPSLPFSSSLFKPIHCRNTFLNISQPINNFSFFTIIHFKTTHRHSQSWSSSLSSSLFPLCLLSISPKMSLYPTLRLISPPSIPTPCSLLFLVRLHKCALIPTYSHFGSAPVIWSRRSNFHLVQGYWGVQNLDNLWMDAQQSMVRRLLRPGFFAVNS